MNIQKLINNSKTTIVDVRTEEEFTEGLELLSKGLSRIFPDTFTQF